MPADAFTGGVKPGGLTSVTEIRILLCYLIKTAGPVSKQILENALMQEQLVNYFELNSGLSDLQEQKLTTLENDVYTITKKGAQVSEDLCWDLPRSVRESAANAVLRMQKFQRMAAENQAEIAQTENGYDVRCRIQEHGHDLLSLTISMPDIITAEKVRNSFIKNGSIIYSMFVEELTGKDE